MNERPPSIAPAHPSFEGAPSLADEPQFAVHVPVLLEESLAFLDLERGGTFVDCTLGLGGHSEAMLEREPRARVIGIDRDLDALGRARTRLARFGGRFRAVHAEYSDLAEVLGELDEPKVAGILADLGVSSMQLDLGIRGFSFRSNGPLDMRMDTSCGLTAADVVRSYSEEELEKVLRDYGEERQARRIARSITKQREQRPLETTGDLRETVISAVGEPRRVYGRRQPIDPATRTFQALRIEVNQELAGLEKLLDQSMQQLETDGRLVVISYHSLEDRIAKTALRAAARGEVDEVTGSARVETRLIELLTKKPVRPSDQEVETNPRSRSGRLRAARRI